MRLALMVLAASCAGLAASCVSELARKCSVDSDCAEGFCDEQLRVCFSWDDTEQPVLAVQAPASGATVGAQVTISGTASDAISGVSKVEYSFDGTTWAALAMSGNGFAQTVAGPSAGTGIKLAVRATDRAGNAVAISVPINVDLVAPVPAIGVPGADYVCGGAEQCTGG